MRSHGAAAGPVGALTSAVQNVGQRLLTGPSGGNGGGSGGSNGGGRGSANTAAVLTQFRGAGQGTQASQQSAGSQRETSPTSSAQAKPQQPDLSFVKDANTRARLERFSGLGKE